jgi:phosphopantetheinyl transferase (holo-ACP synthase)
VIGNDIIDREAAAIESNWRRQGFLEKIFTKKEQEIITSSTDPDLVVWLLWSMKESAYKIVNRQTGIRKFDPQSYEAILTFVKPAVARGFVYYQKQQFSTRSKISPQIIDTVAVEQDCLLDFVSDISDQEIVKIGSLPFDKLLNPISKSQHGRYRRAVSLTYTKLVF